MSRVKVLSKMPESGQFVEIHEYQGNLWSETLRWNEGELEFFNIQYDTFEIVGDRAVNRQLTFKYLVLSD